MYALANSLQEYVIAKEVIIAGRDFEATVPEKPIDGPGNGYPQCSR